MLDQSTILNPGRLASPQTRTRELRRGMSLIEIMFSVSILSVALVSVIGGVVNSYEANALIRQRTVALESARSLIDDLRSARNEGFMLATDLKQLAEKFSTQPEKLNLSNLRGATRTLNVSLPYPGLLAVDVVVEWEDLRGRPARVILSSALSNHE